MKLIRSVVVPVMLTALAGPVLAAGSQYKVTFDDNGVVPEGAKVSVLFVAAGCAGVKRCGKKGDNNSTDIRGSVCKQVMNLKPGETTRYTYKIGTTGRGVWVCSNARDPSTFQPGRKFGAKKHTYVCAYSDGNWFLGGKKNCGN